MTILTWRSFIRAFPTRRPRRRRVVTWLISTGEVGAEVGEELIDFLGAVAAATAYVRDLAFFVPLLPALEVSIVEAHPVVVTLLDAPAPQVRLPQLAAERRPLATRLRRWAAHQTPQRLQCVALLGEPGEQVGDFLTDADPAVRIRAALAPASRGDSRAIAIIVAALGEAPPAGGICPNSSKPPSPASRASSTSRSRRPPSPAGPAGPASAMIGIPCWSSPSPGHTGRGCRCRPPSACSWKHWWEMTGSGTPPTEALPWPSGRRDCRTTGHGAPRSSPAGSRCALPDTGDRQVQPISPAAAAGAGSGRQMAGLQPIRQAVLGGVHARRATLHFMAPTRAEGLVALHFLAASGGVVDEYPMPGLGSSVMPGPGVGPGSFAVNRRGAVSGGRSKARRGRVGWPGAVSS
ncbi:hypothetical protein ABT003_48750, partial [Streptosporangium roseum]